MKPHSIWSARLASVLIALLPVGARAEGAEMIWTCQSVTTCDAKGVCVPASASVEFHLTAVNAGEDGTGSYRIAYDGISADMIWLAYNGPLQWFPTDGQQDMLLFADNRNLIWQKLQLGNDGGLDGSTTTFLTCEPRK